MEIVQTTVVSVSPFAVITFARNGKIARRVQAIAVLALIQLSVEMLPVMVKKPAIHALQIAVNVLLQIRIVGMEHANTIIMRTVSCVQKTVERVLPLLIQSVGMELAIQMNGVIHVHKIVVRALLQVQSVGMEFVKLEKIVLLAPVTALAPARSHPVLMEKCAMIQMFV